MRRLAFTLALALLAGPASAAAQAGAEKKATGEQLDPTRLDVERLPPEAVALRRDMFARGLFMQTHLGGRGFVGGAGRVSLPGVLAHVGIGYELSDWLALGGALEMSLHETSAPAPPSADNFELLDLLAELRLQLPLSARAAPWLGVEAGLDLTAGQALAAYGITRADSLGVCYGGTLGFDWHLLSRHYSLGLLAGARLYPNLDRPGDRAIGIHSAAYLRYVF
jgi:hypothetical protein